MSSSLSSSPSTAVPAKLKLVVMGMLLCAWGVAWQMQHLPRTTTTLSGITSTTSSTSTQPQVLPSSPSSSSTRSSLSSYLEQGPELYIPSMEYRIQEQLQILKQQEQQSREHADCSHAAKPLEWEFFNVYHGNHGNNTTSSTPPRSVLIGISSGHDEYAKFLTYTAHAAKVYAQQASQHYPNVNVTVAILQGTALAPEGCTPPPIQASLNKIRLFFYAIDQARNLGAYDQVLLLEADALLVVDGTTQDVTQLLSKKENPHDVLVAGQPYRNTDTPQPPHKINAGATLWNLHHPLVRTVALQWFQSAKEAVYQGTYQGDARHLQFALEAQQRQHSSSSRRRMIQHTTQEFNYQEGTWVQHFLQSGKKITWHDRYKRLQQAHAQLCRKQATACQQVPRKDYYQEEEDAAAATTITTTKESSFQ